MKSNGIISKGTSFLLLSVIIYMHLCSALCATGASVCCDKEDNDGDHHKKECCRQEKNSKEEDKDCEDKDCQSMHFAFFNATGQFWQAKADPSFKAYQPLLAIVVPLVTFQSIETGNNIFAYNGFHPPPPKSDMRIFIGSFLI